MWPNPSWVLQPAWTPIIKPFCLPEPVPGPEPFRKKEVVEILSHKKAYNTCEGLGSPRGMGDRRWPSGPQSFGSTCVDDTLVLGGPTPAAG